MGVLGAFVFAAQMINFAIPATGSSGHLGGGLLLAILLGPHAAFLAMASVLVVQALFFADGGLLALGCNIFNLGFFPAFVAYPLVYQPLAGTAADADAAWPPPVVAAVVGLQLGAFGVVLETVALRRHRPAVRAPSLLLMQPIHLAIGLVEGLVTAAVSAFVCRARPGDLTPPPWRRGRWAIVAARHPGGLPGRRAGTGGVVSWFASAHPDGLEWAIARVTGSEELPDPAARRARAAGRTLQEQGWPLLPCSHADARRPRSADVRRHQTSAGVVRRRLLTLAICLPGRAAPEAARRKPCPAA